MSICKCGCKEEFKNPSGRKRYKDGHKPLRLEFTPKPCVYCLKNFVPLKASQLYCSNQCRSLSKQERVSDIICVQCGILFKPKSYNQKTCSRQCGSLIKKGRTPWNKGLTKETSEYVAKNAEGVRATAYEKALERYAQFPSDFTPDQLQVFLGSMLGDGSIRVENSCFQAAYQETHGNKQEAYIKWKLSYFQPFNGRVWSSVRGRDGELQWYLRTTNLPIFTKYRELFYPEGTKTLLRASDELYKLGPLGLAVWFMDDGYVNKQQHQAYFATNCFSLREHLLLRRILKDNFGLYARIVRRRQQNGKLIWQLNLDSHQTQYLFNIIEAYICDSMKYKVLRVNTLTGKPLVDSNGRPCIVRRRIRKRKYYRGLSLTPRG